MARRYRRKHFASFVTFIVAVLVVVATQSGWLESGTKTAEINQPGLYTVTHYVDGDTIDVNMNGATETIRFIGVDTPETHKPNTPVQCYGELAAANTKNVISKYGKVRLQADPLDTNRDRYGRLLRYVYLPDGTLMDEKIIQGGYGFAYTLFPFSKKAQFSADMQAAQAAKRGLWGACQIHQETDGVYQTNSA
ncbi:MAG TPA: thermonuclease family protein [Candidatus Saccharimonadales bacterium]|nr:thermonuclease family protein [Candidatus Saccharimonadales bacterium]